MDKGKEPIRLMMKKEDIGTFISENPGLLPNEGSVLTQESWAKGAPRDLKKVYGDKMTQEAFLDMMTTVLQPGWYGAVRLVGSQGLQEAWIHGLDAKMEGVVLVEQGEAGALVLARYDRLQDWLDPFLKGIAAETELPEANYLPPKTTFEGLLFVLHAVDAFRRMSYENMLKHIFSDQPYVIVSDFLKTMADALKSRDIRWLLPAFMEVTPGVEAYEAKIDPEHMAVLFEQDFFRKGKLASGEDVLVFGEAGQVMGVEFFRSWYNSYGMRFAVKEGQGFVTKEQWFIAPTLLGNHLIRLDKDDQGKSYVNHQMFTKEQLIYMAQSLLKNAFIPRATKEKHKLEPKTVPEIEAGNTEIRFCGNCGAQVIPGAAFCGSCGNKLA